MYQIVNSLAPTALLDYFNKTTHHINTRQTDLIETPQINIEFYKRSFLYHGFKLWNELPEPIKLCPTLNIFKILYKSSISSVLKDSFIFYILYICF